MGNSVNTRITQKIEIIQKFRKILGGNEFISEPREEKKGY